MGFDLASITSAGVGSLMSGIGELAKDLREAITGDLPAEKKADIQAKLLELDNQVMIAQMAVTLEEAKSEHIFVAGWRPAVGWIGAFALAYAAIIEPCMSWVAMVYGYKGEFPAIDTTITMQVLMGILGIGVMRSVDKAQAPSPKGKE